MTIINFAHANGFPASSYKKLLHYLPDQFSVIAKEKYAHEKHRPVSDNWANQVDELIDFVSSNASEPVYAVGHSFGGVISFMACCRRPDLFKGLIMMEPPIVSGMSSSMFRVLKKTPFIDKFVPSGKSKFRKSFWSPNESVLEYFKPKALFRHFDDDCLSDYVRAATKKEKEGTRLVYEVAVETQLFRFVPHNIHKFDKQLKVPAKLFTAEHTNVCFPRMVRGFLKGNPEIQHQLIKSVGHMFPLEKPEMTTKLIVDTINQMEQECANQVQGGNGAS